MCGVCKEPLNKCNQGCMDAFECALEKNTLVGVLGELSCEIRATGNLCLTTPETQAAASELIGFDGCLIGARQPQHRLRACEQECGITYTDDVCERYP